MRKFYYASPESVEEALKLAREAGDKEVRFVAGGTDFNPKLHAELDAPPEDKPDMLIVSLGKAGLDQMTAGSNEVRIGALCTLNDIAENESIKTKFPLLSEAINQIGGYTIRNTGTIGGNIVNASPAADSVPALLALGARFEVMGEDGTKEYKAEEFFTGPGKTKLGKKEILTAVIIPEGKGKGSFVKLGKRKAETLSTVNGAAYLEQENGKCTLIRIAIGSVAPTVIKCRAAEEALLGKELSEDNIKAAAEKVVDEISPIDDIRASAWYRKKVAPVVIKRVIQASV